MREDCEIPGLPVDGIRTALAEAIRGDAGRRWILSAPTGSGKSTRLPQFLIDDGLIPSGREVVVLQPRRLAARWLAHRVARERNSPLGSEVGYHVRFDRKTSRETRIRYATEGVLMRQMIDQPDLPQVGAILLDEFHERHLQADAGLALALQLQQKTRPDLMIGVMSATLEADSLAEALHPCSVIHAEGRQFPVEVRHIHPREADSQRSVWDLAVDAVRNVLPSCSEGNILIFMPGQREINRTLERLIQDPAFRSFRCLPLSGGLSPEDQDQVMAESGERRIVVATNVAETSLTLPDIRVVIDSGLARLPGFDPRRGVNTLYTEKISRSSADQRAGRAGRTAPGLCVRLWTASDHAHRPVSTAPEIRRLDLSELFLTLIAAGTGDPEALPWLEPPPPDHARRAWELLRDLGAVRSENWELTPLGRGIATFPLHPRLGRMLIFGGDEKCIQEVAVMAALACGRPLITHNHDPRKEAERAGILKGLDQNKSDLTRQLQLWEAMRQRRFQPEQCRSLGLNVAAAREIERMAGQFVELAKGMAWEISSAPVHEALLRKALLSAFPDQVGRRLDRGTRRCELVGGRRGVLKKESVVETIGLFVAADLEERSGKDGVILHVGMAAEIETEWLRELFPERIEQRNRAYFDTEERRVRSILETAFHDLVLKSEEIGPPEPEAAARILAEEILAGRVRVPAWDGTVESWVQRVNFAARHRPDLGFLEIDQKAWRMLWEDFCLGATRARELRGRDIWATLRSWLPAGMEDWLEREVPDSIRLEGKRRPVRVRYNDTGAPAIALRIQDLYDVSADLLSILEGTCSLRLEILAPNDRPVQVISAERLPEFWKHSYPEVRKDLRGRYPKHDWR